VPLKRRNAKSRVPQRVTAWEHLTECEQAWLQGEPLPDEPYGERWGISDEPAKVDLWRPGRPTATELRRLYEEWKRCR
jgi:hypothetical protein